jgi:hypothetical protein
MEVMGDLLAQNEVYQIDSMGVKRTEYNAAVVGDYAQYAMGSTNLLDLDSDPQPVTKFIRVPMKPVLQDTQAGVEKKAKGLSIQAAV